MIRIQVSNRILDKIIKKRHFVASMRSVSAVAYSSSANLGPGYDTLGIAHNAYFNTVSVREAETVDFEGWVKLEVSGLPASPYENTAGLAATELLKDRGITEKIIVTIKNGIPTGLGLGSSGASAAAVVEALDNALDLRLSMEQKVRYAMLGEAASSGTPHADNVAASLYGGMVLVESIDPVKVRRIRIKDDLEFLTIVPEMVIRSKTKTSRELVPNIVSLQDHVRGVRYASSLISGLITGDREMIRDGMNDDIVERAREQLYPFLPEVKKLMLKYNAVGSCLSGAGPSVLAVVDRETDRDKIIEAAGSLIAKYGYNFKVATSTVAGGADVTTPITS